MGTYTKSSIIRAARPRSERLREAGMSIVSTSAAVAGGGAGFVPSGSTHSHANLDSLNMITVADGYIYLTDSYTDEDTGTEVTETVKASVGFADRAGANSDGYILDWFIPVTVNGALTLKLNPIYAGLWAEGWSSAGGTGTGGGGGGGATFLSELEDVNLGTLTSGNLLAWNGTAWTNIAQSDITPDLSGYATQAWVNGRGFITSESDPVFSASAAAGIAATDIASWNAKTSNTGTVTSVTLTSGTGITVSNSGTAITTSGSRAISISSTYRTYIDHGETAYGWGNHADAGYLTQHQTVTLASGTNNGTLKITTAAGTVDNIAVTGLGSLAYKSSLVKADIPALDYLPLTGGELTGDLWLHTGSANYGSKLWFGDKGSGSGYVYLHEDTDDHLHIHADKGVQISTGSSYGIALENNVALNSACSFTLGSGVLTWDSTNSAWKLTGNFYATGFLTAGGVNTQNGVLNVENNVVIDSSKTVTFGSGAVLSYSSGWKLTSSLNVTALTIGSGSSALNVATSINNLQQAIQNHEQRIAALEA